MARDAPKTTLLAARWLGLPHPHFLSVAVCTATPAPTAGRTPRFSFFCLCQCLLPTFTPHSAPAATNIPAYLAHAADQDVRTACLPPRCRSFRHCYLHAAPSLVHGRAIHLRAACTSAPPCEHYRCHACSPGRRYQQRATFYATPDVPYFADAARRGMNGSRILPSAMLNKPDIGPRQATGLT